MTQKPRYARTSALPAIAAALALSSTTALAQEVQPIPSEPTTTQPAPETTPPVTDTAPATEAAPTTVDSPVTDTTTPDATAAAPAKKATRSAPKRTAAAPVAKSHAAPQATHAATTAVSTAAATPAAPSAPAVAPTKAPTATAAAINDAVNNPTSPAKAAPAKASANNDMALELGGGALALLALGGAAFAFSRRRRHEQEEVWDDERAMEPVAAEPVATVEPAPAVEPRHDTVFEEQPAIVAPANSAFAWGPRETDQVNDDDDGSDRRAGESWIERAYRGPSPANPSVSLKNRLRRAAFFDKRERDVAAGTAKPVDTDAGLPDAMVEEREFA